MECNRLVGDGNVIFGKAYIGNILPCPPVKTVKLIHTERPRNLPRTVWAEVEENNRILVLDGGQWLPILHHDGRNHKFICHILCIRSRHCLNRVCRLVAFPFGQRLISALYPLPAVVTVHGVIAP